jgi:hypothetical protein
MQRFQSAKPNNNHCQISGLDHAPIPDRSGPAQPARYSADERASPVADEKFAPTGTALL